MYCKKMTLSKWLWLGLMASLFANSASPSIGTADEFNYDETKVPDYELPDPLVTVDGRAVKDADTWRSRRRPELLDLFESQVYGRRPPEPKELTFDVAESRPEYLHGKGVRKDVKVFEPGPDGPKQLLKFTLFVPRESERPVPAFVGVHLFDTASDNPLPGNLLQEDVGEPLPGEKLLDVILDRGYAIATLNPDDFCPDDKQTFRQGVLEHYYPERSGPPGAEEPGAIAVWAWGLSRALDYMQQDPQIDANRVAVIGHSRRGKTALWAGAEDQRFALVISNDSGCGGAALSRRRFGETVARINNVFPHWFCDNFNQYNDREGELPIDQHELVALIAPRPVYVASAQEDGWADPKGEFLAAAAAEPVYRLFDRQGLGTDEQPPLNKSVGEYIGYHIRSGKHALTDYDWLKYLDFADKHIGPAQAN